MTAKKKPEPKPPAGKHYCFHCSRPVTKDDFCYGCGGFICTSCDTEPQIGFGHTVQDHKR